MSPRRMPEVDNNPNVLQAIEDGEGILRLAPCWVPRSFLMPGRRLKLHPDDYYALGAHRGGIDERWFSSTTEAANDGREPDEGLSYVLHNGKRFLLRDAVATQGERLLGRKMWEEYKGWPVFSKFFDNLGPIFHHLHQDDAQAALTGQRGKPEAYYFPEQLNQIPNNFPHTYFGLEPGTTRADVRRCLENWTEGDNGILDLARAYRLKPGTGWLVPPRILHAPGSLVTFEPQCASDVFAAFQSLLEGRPVSWDLVVKDVPPDKRHDLDYLVDLLDWDGNTDSNFKQNHYIEPIRAGGDESEGWLDEWIVYGTIGGRQLFSAKKLTVQADAACTIKDGGAFGLIAVQGSGRIGRLRLETPAMIRFGEMTEDEVFVSHDAGVEGVTFENTGPGPLVTLRFFGPDTFADMPHIGDHRRE